MGDDLIVLWWFVIVAAILAVIALPVLVLFAWRISAQLQTLIELASIGAAVADVDERARD